MYIPLYNKSTYSLLSSLLNIDDLINTALEKHIVSLVLCDNNLFGAMEFLKKCSKNNIHPLIGLEMQVEGITILGFAENYSGYQQLLKLTTIAATDPLTKKDLMDHQENVIFILLGEYYQSYHIYHEIVSKLYIGYDTKETLTNALQMTNEVVYLPKNLYLSLEDSKYLRYLYLIRDGKTITDSNIFEDTTNSFNASLENAFYEEGIKNSEKIAQMCNIVFPPRKLLLPIYDCGTIPSATYLKELSLKGLAKRTQGDVKKEYYDRLIYELDVIEKMGFSNYFLVVYDFIKYAKKNHILVGPGRGSAAGSLVSYCLGITDIDPIEYQLVFERFLNPERVSMPDIDTDFPDVYRDKVISYVQEKYGPKRVSGIVTFGTLSCRQVIRDTGRILNIPLKKIDNLCKMVPNNINIKLADVYQKNSDFKKMIDNDITLNEMYKIALRFEGMPRHTSIHAAGIVMSQINLDDIIPLAYSNGMYLAGFSPEYLEELGLLKMDFLGLKNLTTIMNILKDIKKDTNKDIDFNKIPLDDAKTFTIFADGKTSGIFQFESSGMREFLKQLKPEKFEDLIAAIALYRPGAAENIPEYIKRRHGLSPVTYKDPILEPLLKSTYGIMIYQEQVMQTANLFAGYSLAEADILRRAMSKKKLDVLQNEEKKFIKMSLAKGHDEKTAQNVFDLILKFAGYGFNRSHSVAYSLIAYKMAYLKVHYPKAFYTSLLTGVIGSEGKTYEYFLEAKSLGLSILRPSINRSQAAYLMVEDGILFPLASIRNVGTVTCHDIVEARKTAPFESIFDAFSRLVHAKISRKALENLIYAGCFDEFHYNRKTLITNLDNLLSYATLVQDLDESLVMEPELIIEEEYTKKEMLEKELEIFGFYFTNHPSSNYRDNYPNAIYISQMGKYFDKNVTFIVLLSKIKEVTTKKNETMAFLDATDESSNTSFTLFPNQYKIYMGKIKKGDIVKINGRVERRKDRFQVIVNDIIVLE